MPLVIPTPTGWDWAAIRQYAHIALLWFIAGVLLHDHVERWIHPYQPTPIPIPVPVPPTPTPPGPKPTPTPPWIPPGPKPEPPTPTPMGTALGDWEWRILPWAAGWKGYGREVDGEFLIKTWERMPGA